MSWCGSRKSLRMREIVLTSLEGERSGWDEKGRELWWKETPLEEEMEKMWREKVDIDLFLKSSCGSVIFFGSSCLKICWLLPFFLELNSSLLDNIKVR